MAYPFTDGTIYTQTIAQAVLWALGKLGVGIAFGRQRYTGSAWETVSSVGNVGLGTPVWSSTKATVPLTDFTETPAVLVSPGSSTGLIVSAQATSTSNIDVFFRDQALAAVTTEVNTMDYHILVIGKCSN